MKRLETGASGDPAGRTAREGLEPGYVSWPAAGILVLAVLAAYLDSFAGAFVFDDFRSITDNPTLRHLWDLRDVLSPPLDGRTVTCRPVLNLSFAVNYALGETRVLGYHAVNLAIHVSNVLLLFGIVRRTLRLPGLRERFGYTATFLALSASLLWGVHPLQTEAVTYVVQRAESLSGLFYLLTLYCVLRGATSGRNPWWAAGAVLACWLGMGTKETVVTAPIAVLLFDRAFLAGSFRDALRRRSALYLAFALAWGVVAWGLSQGHFRGGTAGLEVRHFTWWSYLLTQPAVILQYLRLSFWPSGQSIDYAWPAARSVGAIVPPALAVLGLAGLTLWACWKRPRPGFLGAWFFLILAPTSSIVPFEDALFEHRMYLPSAAVVLAAVLTVYGLAERCASRFRGVCRSRLVRSAVLVLPVSLTAAALGASTAERNRDYRSEISIWQDAAEKNPMNARARNNLGFALEDAGRLDEAIGCYREALRLDPGHASAHGNLATALARLGWTEEAVAEYREALRLTPGHARTHGNLARALVRLGRTDEAVAEYQTMMNLEPVRDPWPYNGLAWIRATSADARQRDGWQAVELARRAVELAPENPALLDTLAAAYAEAGRFPEAVETARRALERAKEGGNRSLLESIASRLRLYEVGNPFREPLPPGLDSAGRPAGSVSPARSFRPVPDAPRRSDR